MKKRSLTSELRMLRELAWYLIHFKSTHCYLCLRRFDEGAPPVAFTFGHRRHPRLVTRISIHHENKDRQNNTFFNLFLCHKSCHEQHHAKERADAKKAAGCRNLS
jgi:hypothetical protein